MDKKNVFVFPCGSEIGLEICRSLRYNKHFCLFGGSSDHNNHGAFVYPNYYDKELPLINEKGFIAAINNAIKMHNIDFLYPASDDALVKLALNRHRLACELIASDNATIGMCRSKRITYRRFKNLLPVPEVYSHISPDMESELPIFAKPDKGQGSNGTYLINGFGQYIVNYTKDTLYLEYLPGPEYTIDCFTDRKGKLCFVGARLRKRIKNGISVRSEKVSLLDKARFSIWAKIINKNLKLRGAWFFQAKKTADGNPKLLEIEPRIAGTMGYYRVQGINFAALSLYDRMEHDVELINNDLDMISDRALQTRYNLNYDYDTVYLDLDDCLLLDKKVNELISAFIYQCRNKGILVNILTKHDWQEIPALIDYFRLPIIPEEVIWVEPDHCKSDYIKIEDKNAIFLDDSFTERKEVHEKCGIPVFDVDGVEALLET